MYKFTSFLFVVFAFSMVTKAQNEFRTNVSTFDAAPLTAKGFNNGSDGKGGFWNGHFFYRNAYDTSWKSWSGISISKTSDTITNSYTNEYSSITGGGINGTKNYAVCYFGGTIIPEKSQKLTGFYVTNTTYAYRTIKAGSSFSKKFGGTTGNDKDWFRIRIRNYSGGKKSDSLLFYLADYQNDDNTKDYIINKWTWIDLNSFQATDSLLISFESSDVGQFGINTPTYVAIDDFNAIAPDNLNMNGGLFFNNNDFFAQGKVWNGQFDTSGGFAYGKLYFENSYNTQYGSFSGWAVSKDSDTSKSGFDAQYSSITANGASTKFFKDSSFAISYGRSVVRLPYKKGGWPITYFRFSYTNNTYTYKSMKYGDGFSKKFGGILGTDQDYLKLYVIGYDENNTPVDTLGMDEMRDEMALADFRMNRKYLNKNWTAYVSGSFKKNIVRMEFELESTDVGQFGMNTPAYFCLDNLFEYPIESVTNSRMSALKVYPNPASNYLIADIQNATEIEITDLSGKKQIRIESPSSNEIDISGLAPGVYCLKVGKGDMIYMARFIKQ